MVGWVPRGVDPSTREVLVEGVPSYMRAALLEFLRPHLAGQSLQRECGYSGVT